MPRPTPLSRRTFIASTSAALIAASSSAEESKKGSGSKLAIDGGERAVARELPRKSRWGGPEREQLMEMLDHRSLFYWKGPRTQLLKERFRKHYPLKHVQTCSSGTAAIHIAVASAGIGPGDEVITTPITDIGTVIGVLFQQAVPVFADLEPNTYNLSVDDVARRITPRTKAIIAVHLAGAPCDMDGLKGLAKRHDLVLIEDCAQAWGTRYRGSPVGTIGHYGCFSLMNGKHITCGDGGVVASSDERFGPVLQPFGDKGNDRVKEVPPEALAANYRMSEPQAAVAAAQMERLEGIAATRHRLGTLLTEEIADLPGVEPHHVDGRDRGTYWFYMLRLRPERFRCPPQQFVKALRAEGAAASAGYIPVPLYGLPLFQKHSFFAGRWPVREMGLTEMDYRKVHCPEAEAILKTAVRLRLTEAMDEEYIKATARAVRKVAGHFAT